MFGGGNDWMFGDMNDGEGFDDFINILAQDDYKSFQSMFRNLGKNYRGGPKGNARTRAAKAGKGIGGGKRGGGGKEEDMMEEMMAMMMMGAMGLDENKLGPFGGKKNKKKQDSDDDGDWETVEKDGKKVEVKPDDDGWETESD